MKHTNLSIFIPHIGCRNCCAFCNQNLISGQEKPPTIKEVEELLFQQQLNLQKKGITAEISFFGGSFTGISKKLMVDYLEVASFWCRKYPQQFSGIRCSTRPDFINQEVLDLLKSYPISTIELGGQSTCNTVLAANRRGHTREEIFTAARLIKDNGISLGLQMMTGLYRADFSSDLQTAKDFISMGADMVRIYPTVVLKGTYLAKLMAEGQYKTYNFDQTVELSAELLQLFDSAKIPVIRLGLHASEFVEKEMVGGVYHPTFREICESRIYFYKLLEEFTAKKGSKFRVYTDKKNISKIIGFKRENVIKLKNLGYDFKIKESLGENLLVEKIKEG